MLHEGLSLKVPATVCLRDSNFLIRFFRNLLSKEESELKNRYMVVNVPEEVKDEADPTTTLQVPNKLLN